MGSLSTLPVLNLNEARFECIFGRGCDGICCQNGRPAVGPEERQRIDENLHKILPQLRPQARALVEKEGFVSRREKLGQPMVRVIDGWCVFFHQGCVLHKVGAAEGDSFRYKPYSCALFPLARDEKDRWYVRQRGYKGEAWDLFCLAAEPSTPPAALSLRQELQMVAETHAAETAAQQQACP